MQNRKKEVDYTLKKYVTVFIFLYILKDTYQVFLNKMYWKIADSLLAFLGDLGAAVWTLVAFSVQ